MYKELCEYKDAEGNYRLLIVSIILEHLLVDGGAANGLYCHYWVCQTATQPEDT